MLSCARDRPLAHSNRLDLPAAVLSVLSPLWLLADVHGLAEYLISSYTTLSSGTPTAVDAHPHAVLLTGQPACGKTTLIRQITTLVLTKFDGEASALFPVVVRVQLLQNYLDKHPERFGQAWNWVEARLPACHRWMRSSRSSGMW